MRLVLIVRYFSWLAIALLVALTLVGSEPAIALQYDKEILIGEDFSGQDLTASSFAKANVRRCDFSGANLTGVSFFAANMDEAILVGANLSFATLDSARLTRADLTDAVLEGAFAASTRFEGATIDGADFTDVLLRPDTQAKLCEIAKGTNPTTGRDTRETLLCY